MKKSDMHPVNREELEAATKMKVNVDKILAIIDEYGKDLTEETLTERLGIKGKQLSIALREHPGWVAYYKQRKAELKGFRDQLEAEVERIHCVFYSYYNENNSRDLGDRALGQYVKRESNYNKAVNVRIEIETLLDQYSAVCDAFESRGFQLRDITAARVAEVHDAIL